MKTLAFLRRGSGAGVSINPIAFLVVGRNNTIKMIPTSPHAALDRALDNIPNLIEQIKKALEPGNKKDKNRDEKESDTEGQKGESIKAALDDENDNSF